MTTRKLVTLALLLAIQVVISALYIPISDTLRITFSFIVMMIVGMMTDIKTAILYGLLEDISAFIVFPSGPFFIGYTLGTMVAMSIYSLFLYREVTIKQIIFAKTAVTIIHNIILNSLWNAVLYTNDFFYYFALSVPKNLILLPCEIAICIVLYRAIGPLIDRHGLK